MQLLKIKKQIRLLALKIKIYFLAIFTSDEARWKVAGHEAGHAFLMLKAGLPEVEAWIEGAGGWARSQSYPLYNWDAAGYASILKIKMAGLAAEQLFFGSFDYSASIFDRQNALNIVKDHTHLHQFWLTLVKTNPGPGSAVAWETMPDCTSAELVILNSLLNETYYELKANKTAIQDIAVEMYKKGYLDETDMRKHLEQSN